MDMAQVPPERSVRDILALCLPQATLVKLEATPSSRLQCVYELVLEGSTRLVLVLAPPSKLRLLRSEHWMIRSEAAVVAWIKDALSPPVADGVEGVPPAADKDGCDNTRGTAGQLSTEKWHRPITCRQSNLLDLLPTLVMHSTAHGALGSPYNIFEPNKGTAISALQQPLTTGERASVDLQVGCLFRQVSQLTSPSRTFGPAVAVLPTSTSLQPTSSQNKSYVGAAHTWSAAFQLMLESVLRDGEDMAVMLSYSTIRKHFRSLCHLLDFVETPRLVVLDGFDISNVLVSREQSLGPTPTDNQWKSDPAKLRKYGASEHLIKMAASDLEGRIPRQNARGHASYDQDGGEGELHVDQPGTSGGDIVVTGIIDWGNCVFGDPLLAAVFDEAPSQSFLQGFTGLDQNARLSELGLESNLVEGKEYAGVRLVMYQMYHAIVSIVREFYRPPREGSARELAARRRLNKLLIKLGEVKIDPKRRHRRPSSDISPAKKQKAGNGEDEAQGSRQEFK